MAIIKKSEFKQMNESTAREKMNDLKKELIKINAQIAMGTLPQSPGRIKEIKRTVTKLNMILNKKTKEEKKTVWLMYAQPVGSTNNFVSVRQ